MSTGTYGWFIKNGTQFVNVVNAASKQISLVTDAAQATRFNTAAQARAAVASLNLGAPYTIRDASIPTVATVTKPAAPTVPTAAQVRADRKQGNLVAIRNARLGRIRGGSVLIPATNMQPATPAPIKSQTPVAATPAPAPAAPAPAAAQAPGASAVQNVAASPAVAPGAS